MAAKSAELPLIYKPNFAETFAYDTVCEGEPVMLLQFVLATVLKIVFFTVPVASTNYEFVQANGDFLNDKQIVMLLSGTQISHEPPKGRGEARLLFQESGYIRFTAPNGTTGKGKWRITGSQVVCVEGIGIAGQKAFCIKIRRKGKEIWHYMPQTGEKLQIAPWVIRKPGPNAGLVPSS